MKRYEEYKDSGIQWVRKIPTHWEILKFNRLIEKISTGLNPRENFVLGEGCNYYVTIKNFKNNSLFLDEKCDKIDNKALKIINKRSDLKQDDILFASIFEEPQIYRIEEKPENWNINESVFSIRSKKEILKPIFLQYLLVSVPFYIPLKVGATGSTFQSVKIEKLKNNLTVLPTLQEQIKIANYLDQKTAQIDAVIEKKKELIDHLKQYRQSLITETVTKGLDRNAPMKDSGVTWIGEIPAHWEVKKLKKLFKVTSGGTPKSTEESYWNGEIIWITPKDLSSLKDIHIYDSEKKITKKGFENCSATLIPKNSLIISKRAPIGYVAIAGENLSTNQGCCNITPIVNDLNPKFYYYFMKISKDFLESLGQGTTFLEMPLNDFSNSYTIFPELKEQDKIVSFLDEKVNLLNENIKKADNLVSRLQQYRQSLISEAVTGKIKID